MCDADAQSLRNGASLADNALDKIMFAQSTLARTSSTQAVRGHIDKPKSPYQLLRTNELRKTPLFTQFNRGRSWHIRGMVLEIFGAHLFGPDLDDEKTSSQRGGNG